MRFYSCLILSYTERELRAFDMNDQTLDHPIIIDVPSYFPDTIIY